MAEKYKTLDKISEKNEITLLPEPRTFIVGIYREKKQIVVRKFEEISGMRVCLDEQYALNVDDAIVIQNIMIHQIHNFQLN